MKRIIFKDSISAYIDRNDEKTIIDRVCEEAAEDGILSDMELEQIHEEMLDELYQKQYEQEQNEKEMRKAAYRKIAEYLWHKGAPADVYEQWLEICIKEGAL